MSGVVKGVKKVFKKVGKVVKKILPFALPIAAAVFTIGGALGVAGMAGGWSGAIGKLAGTSTLGKILGGAVTQAGYGGLIGGGIGAITGGKKGAIKGLGIGQMVGAATGAATGAIGAMSAPAASSASSATQSGMAAGANPGSAPGAIPGASTQGLRGTQVMSSYGSELPGQYAASPNQIGLRQALQPVQSGAIQTGAAQQVTRAAQTLPSAGMVPGMAASAAPATAATGFKSLDPIVQASMITAGAQALPAAIGALTGKDEEENQQLAVEEARRKAINQNYSGLSFPKPAALSSLRAAPRYVYDETAGRIVLKYS